MSSPTGHRPHPYGDCDSCGDPDNLLSVLEEEAKRLDISLSTSAANSWDLSISIGARDAARLILALRQTHLPPDPGETDLLLLALVKGINEIGG